MDRDGVLNRDSPDFIKSPEEFELLPGAAEAVARLNGAGYPVFVITNQSGIPRGLLTESTLNRIHEKLLNEISEQMGRPEVARDVNRFMRLSNDFKQAESNLRALYEEWDTKLFKSKNVL